MRPCYILSLSLCVAVVGCSHTASTLPTAGTDLGVARAGSQGQFTTLYSFKKHRDGDAPNAALLPVGQTLYGTTRGGGSGHAAKGTIFAFSNGSEQVLHTFSGPPDGARPWDGLVELNGLYYGTTQYGGAANRGTVFSVDASGNEQVVYSFQGGSDGVRPLGGLMVANGALYGTTATGGSSGKGTIFEVTTAGEETVLHSFSGSADGAYPTAPLVETGGLLYGTTRNGGSKNKGTVFSIKTDGTGESVLYSFQGGSDAAAPIAGVTPFKGALYGTALHGGAYDRGAIFEVTTSGSERVAFSFAHHEGHPLAGLTPANQDLYGTTLRGGGHGAGTVFQFDPASGKETVLHTFSGGADGYAPAGQLVTFGGNLVGTTRYGGTANLGTIYSVAP